MNFAFLSRYENLEQIANKITELSNIDTSSAIAKSRVFIEIMVGLLNKKLDIAYEKNEKPHLANQLLNPEFIKKINNRSVMNIFHFIRKQGNIAAHDELNSQKVVQNILQNLYILGRWFAEFMQNGGDIVKILTFRNLQKA